MVIDWLQVASFAAVARQCRVVRHLSAAVDQVRRSENRAFRQQGDDRLAKTRYLGLMRRGNMTQRQRRAFTPLRTSTLQVARAWAIKELAMQLWNYRPVCGTGGMLLDAIEHVQRAGGNPRTFFGRIFGEEKNLTTSSIARMNLVLYGVEDLRIEQNDTLRNPAFTDATGALATFDCVIANPPFSFKE